MIRAPRLCIIAPPETDSSSPSGFACSVHRDPIRGRAPSRQGKGYRPSLDDRGSDRAPNSGTGTSSGNVDVRDRLISIGVVLSCCPHYFTRQEFGGGFASNSREKLTHSDRGASSMRSAWSRKADTALWPERRVRSCVVQSPNSCWGRPRVEPEFVQGRVSRHSHTASQRAKGRPDLSHRANVLFGISS